MDLSSGLREICEQVGGNVLSVKAVFGLHVFVLDSTLQLSFQIPRQLHESKGIQFSLSRE